MSGSTSVAHTKGTPSRSAIWVATIVDALWFVPVMAAAPRWIAFSVWVPATSGLLSVSTTKGLSLAPPSDLMPPCSFTRSHASWKPFQVRCPHAAFGPVSAMTAPSTISFACAWAYRLTAKPPRVAVPPARNFRRVTVTGLPSIVVSHEGCLFKGNAASWDTPSNLPSVLGGTLSWTRGAAYSPLEPRGLGRSHAGSPAAGGIPPPALLVVRRSLPFVERLPVLRGDLRLHTHPAQVVC